MGTTETITLRLVLQDLMSGNVSKAIAGFDKLTRQGGLLGWTLKGVGISMGNMLNPAALVAQGIGAITDAAGEAINAASDLAEQSSKVGEVFDEQADQVRDWARSLDSSFGITERQALTTAGTLGNLFDAMGLGTTQTREMSTALTELAGDLASFNNADIKEVLTALQSGIVGETEPMRRFGVDLSAAAVEAKALALGLAASAKALTQGDKVQARYALIMEKTASAQGDAARTVNTLAGKQRQMNAQIGNLQTKIGSLLVGPASGFIGFLNGVVDVIDGPNGVERRLQDAADAIHRLNVEAKAAAGPGVSPIAKMNKEMQDWADTLRLQEFNFDPQTFDWLERLGPDTLRNFGPASADVLARIAAIARAVQETGGTFSDFGREVRQVISDEVPGSFNILTNAWTGVSEAVEESTGTIVKQAGRIRAVPFQMLRSLTDVKADWKAGWKNLAEWAKHPFRPEAFSRYINRQTEKALAKANDPELPKRVRRNWRRIAHAMESPILASLVNMGMSLDEAVAKIMAVQQMAKRVDPLAVVVTGAGGGNANNPGNNAGGTSNWRGGWTWVGEQGPEMMNLPQGTRIRSNSVSGDMGGGSVHVHFHGLVTAPSEADLDRIARKLAPGMQRVMARAGA